MNIHKILIVLIILLRANMASAQESNEVISKKLEHSLFIGYNFGGLAPVSFPENIRAINSYSPGFSPAIGYEVIFRLDEHWGIGSGMRLDYKGMSVRDSVQYFHTQVSVDDASVEGDFSGTNTTNVKNLYLSLPVYAVYQTDNHWTIKLGFYASRLIRPSFSGSVSDGYLRKGDSLGEKITITSATFNFDEKQRKTDFGLFAGGEKMVYKDFSVKADLQWGLRPVFPDSFTGISFNMYNIFATLGISYQF
ncbi:outer membrane beta-barrel protein [Pedobacter sp. MC2016-05]|uniref:outer membrane beta-barrel protein n=1 Tax=Pedobacter sp. MC2016-05 TaxID=2994474 RepID=UPI002245889D|nr:outer membrane beta-barrel protein [Pedobacter sp. MC2016-05]MCX2477024.1 outer membrane beta-barrel protein [Pedobacter sp. MC2016-05]